MQAIDRLRQRKRPGARPGRTGEAPELFVVLLLAACVGAGLLLGLIEAPGALPF